jgi:hypothetical protein
VLAGLSISLPVRNRNQGARSADAGAQPAAPSWSWTAGARRGRARGAHRAPGLRPRARRGARASIARSTNALHDNLELARESFAAGKLDYFELTVVRRELVANRLAYLDAVNEAIDAWTAVQRAAGKDGAR